MKYETYFSKMSQEKTDIFSAYKVDKYLIELIKLLPNDGKLYKYRSFKSNDISLYINALEKKYIWFSSASKMRDTFDSRIRIQLQEDSFELMNLVREKPFLFFKFLSKKTDLLKNIDGNTTKSILEDTVNYIDEDGELKTETLIPAFHKYGMSTKEAKAKIESIKDIIKEILESRKSELIEQINLIAELPTKQREKTFIFCMCERKDNNFLWDIYSDGDGFSIEYDFNKALNLDLDIKRKLLCTLKIQYCNNSKRFSMANFFKEMIEYDSNKEFYRKQSLLLLEQLITKDSSYSSEEEWRIIQYESDNELYADLVSKIIIDEKNLDNEYAIKILEIAKINKWKVEIRRFDKYNNEYYYDEFNYI